VRRKNGDEFPDENAPGRKFRKSRTRNATAGGIFCPPPPHFFRLVYIAERAKGARDTIDLPYRSDTITRARPLVRVTPIFNARAQTNRRYPVNYLRVEGETKKLDAVFDYARSG